MLEELVPVVVRLDGECLHLRGDAAAVRTALAILDRMRDAVSRGATLTADDVRLAAEGTVRGQSRALPPTIATTARGKEIRPKTESQRTFVEAIDAHALTFGIGPAGTGKTFLAVAMAVRALKEKRITRIVLTRPAVEAGEKLGFLPGDFKDKVDPYLRPLYDALGELLDDPAVAKALERGTIEVAPLAFMRGRTLADAFIILDEAQNATRSQMKMFLTRLGPNSKMIVNGDVTQIDLPRSERSGLLDAHALFDDVPEIAIVEFGEGDVVRDPLVGKIVSAYRRLAERNEAPRSNPT